MLDNLNAEQETSRCSLYVLHPVEPHLLCENILSFPDMCQCRDGGGLTSSSSPPPASESAPLQEFALKTELKNEPEKQSPRVRKTEGETERGRTNEDREWLSNS